MIKYTQFPIEWLHIIAHFSVDIVLVSLISICVLPMDYNKLLSVKKNGIIKNNPKQRKRGKESKEQMIEE